MLRKVNESESSLIDSGGIISYTVNASFDKDN